MKHFPVFMYHKSLVWVAYSLAAVVVSLLKWQLGFNREGYTAYENYRIFRNASAHLWQTTNVYAAFPAEQWDLFKYSPAFALGMAPFTVVPDGVGLCAWNLLNALLLLYALFRLPILNDRQAMLCAWLVLPELVISLQNSQSNGLTAGALLLAFGAFERGQLIRAGGWVTGAAFIKVFGLLAAGMYLLYPGKFRFLRWLAFWTVLFAGIPFLFFEPDYVQQLYRWWWELLRDDHSASVGLSVQGWLLTWFGWAAPKNVITVVGLVLLALGVGSVARNKKANTPQNRIYAWAALLLWVVIFNHKAESPTFIIALCGAAIWYASVKPSKWWHLLFILVFLFSSLSPTDVFPAIIRKTFVEPFVLKAVPCIVLWIIITFALVCKRNLFGSAPKA